MEDILEEILPQAGLPPVIPERSPLLSAPEAGPDDNKTIPPPHPGEVAGLGETETRLLSFITQEPVGVDTLIARSGLTAHEVQSGLLVLALGGIIRQLPGKMFLRKE